MNLELYIQKEIMMEDISVFILDDDFSVGMSSFKSDALAKYCDKVYRRISDKSGIFFHQDYLNLENNPENAKLIVEVSEKGILEIDGDESYVLTISEDQDRKSVV